MLYWKAIQTPNTFRAYLSLFIIQSLKLELFSLPAISLKKVKHWLSTAPWVRTREHHSFHHVLDLQNSTWKPKEVGGLCAWHWNSSGEILLQRADHLNKHHAQKQRKNTQRGDIQLSILTDWRCKTPGIWHCSQRHSPGAGRTVKWNWLFPSEGEGFWVFSAWVHWDEATQTVFRLRCLHQLPDFWLLCFGRTMKIKLRQG